METHLLREGLKVVVRAGAFAYGKKLGSKIPPDALYPGVEDGEDDNLPTGQGHLEEDVKGVIHAFTAEYVKVRTTKLNIISIPKLDINHSVGAADHLDRAPTLVEQLGLPPVPFSPEKALRRAPLAGDLALHIPTHRTVQVYEVGDKGVCKVKFPGESELHEIDARLMSSFFTDPDLAPEIGFTAYEDVVGRNKLGYLNRSKCYLVSTIEALDTLIDDLYYAPDVSLDTETRGLVSDAFVEKADFVVGICLAGDANLGYYIPIGHIDPERARRFCPELVGPDGKLTRPPRTETEGWVRVRASMYPDQLDRNVVVEKLRPLLAVKRTIMHNSAFDLLAMDTLGLRIEADKYGDTLFVSKLENDNRPGHGLKMLAGNGYFSKAAGKHVPSVVQRKVRIKFSDTAEDNILTYVHPFQCTDYAAADAADTYAVNEQLEPIIKRVPSIWDYYQNVELPFNRRVVVDHIVTGGVRVKRDPIQALHTQLGIDIAEAAAKIKVIVQPFEEYKRQVHDYTVGQQRERVRNAITANYIMVEPETVQGLLDVVGAIRSLEALQEIKVENLHTRPPERFLKVLVNAAGKPDDNFVFSLSKKAHLIELIHTYWKLRIVKLTKAGQSSITKNTIPYLRAETGAGSPEREFFDLLIEHTKAAKLIQAFTTPLLVAIDKSLDGFIHPDFSSLGAKSSRSSCRLPNLQQLPSRSKYDVRAGFMPDDDSHVFVDCDYEAQELRVMAAFSRDPKMLELIEAGQDLHCYTVRAVWPELANLSDDDIKTNHKSKRNAAKAVMFGIAYGIGSGKLAEGLTAEALSEGKPENAVTKEQAQAIIDGFKKRAYPRLSAWFDEIAAIYRRQGFMDLPGGYRRRHAGFFDDNSENASIRSCCNTNIQGTSGWMMKAAALRVIDLMQDMIDLGMIAEFRVSMIIHDQLIGHVRAVDSVQALKLTEQAMSSDLLGVPVPVEGHIARSYSKNEEKWYKTVLKPAIKQHGVEAALSSDLGKLQAPSEGVSELVEYVPETPRFIAVEVGEVWDDGDLEIAS